MATVVLDPMFMSVKGSLEKIVLYKRRGVQCARTYVVPRNPDTAAQRAGRRIFADAVRSWQCLSTEEKTRYNRKALKMKMSGYNLFISRYMKTNTETGDYSSDTQLQFRKTSGSDPLRLRSVTSSVQVQYRKHTGLMPPAGMVPG